MMNVFLTGTIGAGKSTMVQRLLSLYPGKPVHGFYTRKEPAGDGGISRICIHGAKAPLWTLSGANCFATCAGIDIIVDVRVLETIGVELLCGIPPGSLVVMDELGFLESGAPAFCAKVLEILGGPYQVVGTLRDGDTAFLQAVREHPSTLLYRVTPADRDTLFARICQDLQDTAR